MRLFSLGTSSYEGCEMPACEVGLPEALEIFTDSISDLAPKTVREMTQLLRET